MANMNVWLDLTDAERDWLVTFGYDRPPNRRSPHMSVTTVRAKVVNLVDTNKAKIAAVVPFVLTIVGVLLNGAITGEFNGQELRIAIGGLITAALTAFGVYQTAAGDADVEVPVDPAVAPKAVSERPAQFS